MCQNSKQAVSIGLVAIFILVIIACINDASNRSYNYHDNNPSGGLLSGLMFIFIVTFILSHRCCYCDNERNYTEDDNKDYFTPSEASKNNVNNHFLQPRPKIDGCCIFPNSEKCKKYTPQEISADCCNSMGTNNVKYNNMYYGQKPQTDDNWKWTGKC